MPPGLEELRITGGEYAMLTHLGPYSGLGETWGQFLGEWLIGSNLRLANGLSVEIHRNTPMTAPRDKLLTELYAPVIRAA